MDVSSISAPVPPSIVHNLKIFYITVPVEQISSALTAEYSAVSATLLLYTDFIHITKH